MSHFRQLRAALIAAAAAFTLAACGTTVNASDLAAQPPSTGGDSGLSAPGSIDATPVGSAAPGAGAGHTAGPTGVTHTQAAPLPVDTGTATITPTHSTRGPGNTGHAPIPVGFFVAKDAGQAFKNLGYSGLSTGDGAQEVRASVKVINARGGLAGHPIKPVIFEEDATSTNNSTYQSACSQWFQDNHVTAVVSVAYNPVLTSCSQQNHAAFIYAALSNSLSASALASASTTVINDMPTIETAASALTDSLVQRGFFKTSGGPLAKPVVGLLLSDDPSYANVKSIVTQRLQAAGLSLKDSFAMPPGNESSDLSKASTAGVAAALRFKADGVNRLIMVSGGFAASWFGVGASTQNYFPRIGWGSMEEPGLEPTIYSAKQLNGAMGIGWAPDIDTPVRYQPVLGSHGATCIKALRAGGINTTVSATRAVAFPLCDGLFLLAAAADRATALDGPSLIAGVQSLGASYSSSVVFTTDFTHSRAAAASARPLAYLPKCDCFRYTGPPSNLS